MEKGEIKSYRSDEPIHDFDVHSSFKYRVAEQVGGEGLLRCLKCGACSGGCPVGSVIDYRPRKIMGKVLLGLEEQVLSSDDIWLCAACFTCEERCIQEVNFTDIVTILRNMAVQEGKGAKGYLKMAKMVLEIGRVSARTGTVDKMREKLGLPVLQDPAIEDIKRIAEITGFYDLLALNKEAEEE